MEGEWGGAAHKNCGNFELGRLSKECVLSSNKMDFVSENHRFFLQNFKFICLLNAVDTIKLNQITLYSML